jgi:hypothetical protein
MLLCGGINPRLHYCKLDENRKSVEDRSQIWCRPTDCSPEGQEIEHQTGDLARLFLRVLGDEFLGEVGVRVCCVSFERLSVAFQRVWDIA